MELILFRHGIAIDRADPQCPAEAERHLTPKGVRRTRRASRGLRQVGVRCDLVLTSPYRRARQTAELTMEALGLPPENIAESEEILPMAPPQKLLTLLPRLEAGDLLIVGHAPHLDDFLALATGGDTAFTSLGKAGAAKLVFHDPSCRRAELEWLLTPRSLRALGA
jgi:phosphohistidine phosphatase